MLVVVMRRLISYKMTLATQFVCHAPLMLLVVADYATNSGESKAVATLASLVGLNGHTLTDEILAAVTRSDAADLINRFQNARRDFLIEISTPPRYAHNAKFRAGWLARVERIRKSALALVGTEPPLHQGIPTPKAVPLDTPIEPLASANPMVSAATSPTVISLESRMDFG